MVSVVPSLMVKLRSLRSAPSGMPSKVLVIFRLPRSCVYLLVSVMVAVLSFSMVAVPSVTLVAARV